MHRPLPWRDSLRPRHLALVLAVVLIPILGPAPRAHATPRGKLPPRPVTATPPGRDTLSRAVAGALAPTHADAVNHPDVTCRPRRETLNYHGGALVQNPDVFLLFWGNEWNSDPEHLSAKAALVSMYQNLGTSEYACAWREYAVPAYPLGAGTYNGSFVIASAPPSPLDDSVIRQKIQNEIAAGHAPARSDDRVYVVVPEKGVPVAATDGSTGCGGANFLFCGYHDSFGTAGAPFRYEVLPYPCTSGNGTCFFDGSTDPVPSFESVGSHELTELVTDPDSPPIDNGGWFSDRSGNENADICAGSRCDDQVVVGSTTYTVNPAWSNLAHACITGVACTPPAIECTDSAPGICVPATGRTSACGVEWLADPNLTLVAKTQLPGRTIRCADGQPFCDADGMQDGQCTFRIAACLNSQDPRVPCTPTSITSVKLTPAPNSVDPTNSANAATVLAALATADPGSVGTATGAVIAYSPAAATSNACTGYVNVVVPAGTLRRLGVTAQTGSGTARNRLTLTCSASLP